MKVQKILAIGLVAFATGCADHGDDDIDGRDDDAMRRSTSGTNSDYDSPSHTTASGSVETSRNTNTVTGPTTTDTSNRTRNAPPRMSGTTGSGTPTSSNGSVGTSSVSDLDRVFVNDASSGGMFEVQSGQLALNQLEDDQLKKAAQMIVDDHTLANAELKQIAQRKGIVVPTVLQPQHQDVLTKLRASEGNQFNAEFRRTQVEAHEKAIAMFEQYANNGSDAELKTFAQKCLPKLRMHLDELRDGSNGVGGVEPIAGSEPR